MPIVEADPWRTQYFADVSCPDDVVIPTDDELAYQRYPQHRWIYNKLLICGVGPNEDNCGITVEKNLFTQHDVVTKDNVRTLYPDTPAC